MGNVSVIVADRPTPSQKTEHGLGPRETLFGLYEGVPLTERGAYVPPLPDVITLFQGPIEDSVDSLEGLEQQVRTTVAHEVAHYFGFSDDALENMGIY
jgi:predicted Zn-dependent protease with MMP-like domain